MSELDSTTRFVCLDPTGVHVLIRTPHSLDFVGTKRYLADESVNGIAYVTEWGALLGAYELRWDGRTLDGFDGHQEQIAKFPLNAQRGIQLAARLSPGRWSSVAQDIGGFGAREGVGIYSRATDGAEWMDVIDGRGSAAIGHDHRVIVGTERGNVRVYAPDGGGKDIRGEHRSEVSIDDAIHDLCALPNACVTLTKRPRWTVVRCVTESGIEWTADVSFTARQPPIDGGDGRIYIAGDGLAAITRGVVAWWTPSLVPAMATAFRDSSLAVCRGPMLEIVRQDGATVQRFATPDGTTIVTPPAIGPDGSVWVATASHLYVLR